MGQRVIPPGSRENLPVDLFLVALLSSVTYLSIRTGVKEKGFLKALGWGTGFVTGSFGVISLLAVGSDLHEVLRPKT
jgi:hypothetical protein